MFRAIQLYRLFNLLSFDVVAGALVCALFFARIFSVSIRPYGLMALGLTVWIIYTTDHLRDAKKIVQEAATERHRFHQQHFNTLIILLGVAMMLDAVTIFFIRKQVLEWGLVLALAVSIYLITQRSLKFLKEIFIAALYTVGILLPSFPVTKVELNSAHYILIAQFAIVALINLFMFSWFDREFDRQSKQYSFVTIMGDRITHRSIWLLFMIEVLLTLIQLFLGELKIPALIVAAMGLVLLMIFVFRASFAKHEYYRVLGDAVFLFPVLFLL